MQYALHLTFDLISLSADVLILSGGQSKHFDDITIAHLSLIKLQLEVEQETTFRELRLDSNAVLLNESNKQALLPPRYSRLKNHRTFFSLQYGTRCNVVERGFAAGRLREKCLASLCLGTKRNMW